MRLVTLALLALLALVNAELWFGKGGMPHKMELEAKLRAQKTENDAAHCTPKDPRSSTTP